jgi:hypothetical protein
MNNLEQEIQALKDRNMRVEADKAWETSSFRKVSIAIITYITAGAVMYGIGVKNFSLNALIPTIGYLLSTISIPILKKWWINKHFSRE